MEGPRLNNTGSENVDAHTKELLSLRRWRRMVLFGLPLFALLVVFLVTLAFRLTTPTRPTVVYPSVIEKVREVAVLEALTVQVYKKIDFVPDPKVSPDLLSEISAWVKRSIRQPRGRAIVFGEARFVFDLRKVGTDTAAVDHGQAQLVLPPYTVKVSLDPSATEFVGSNLDSAETAELLALAKDVMERDLAADAKLGAQARSAAEHALSDLLLRSGFLGVKFFDQLPTASPAL
jgi:hypothetical protein